MSKRKTYISTNKGNKEIDSNKLDDFIKVNKGEEVYKISREEISIIFDDEYNARVTEINIKDEIERFKNNHKDPIVWIKTDFGFERKIKPEDNE